MQNIAHSACVTINMEETTEAKLIWICFNIQPLRLRIPGFPLADWHFNRLACLSHPPPTSVLGEGTVPSPQEVLFSPPLTEGKSEAQSSYAR